MAGFCNLPELRPTIFMRSKFLLLFLLLTIPGFAQYDASRDQNKVVDFKDVLAEVSIFPAEERVEGTVDFSFDILQKVDSIFIDAKNMEFENVVFNGKPVKFHNDTSRLWLISNFEASEENSLEFSYSAQPKQAMYFINWNFPGKPEVLKQVWTQGQGRNTSNWLPSFDDMREKLVFDLKINFSSGYDVIANGKLIETKILNDSITQWNYDMLQPMSSYLVAVAAGDYEHKKIESVTGTPISLYYNASDEDKVEPTYRYSKEIFEFLEKEIGVPYPWQNYKQIPVQDFLYAGMENTGTTIFSNSMMVDSIAFNDRSYVNVNAHELAHQWFGNLITETNGSNHWLHEGFATYYALLAEKELFGEDHFYWKLYETAEQLKELSDSGKGEALLKVGAGSLTYYQKGAWALHILKEKLGEEAFKMGVKNYLEKYAYKNVTTDEFLLEMENSSGTDLSQFKKEWLLQSAFQGTQALNSLRNSEFITAYLEIAALREFPLSSKAERLFTALDFPVNDYIGMEAIYQLAGEQNAEALKLYKKAFSSGNLYVRQAIALSLQPIPAELKSDFSSLLDDNSYLTIENTLLKLWMQFPEQADEFLEKTKDMEGFSNKNIRMLWLVLNLVSPEVNPEHTGDYYKELSGYTGEYFPFEVRENAFGYLYQLNAFSDQNLLDLINATQHHTYKFRDFSRKLLDTLLKEEEYRKSYVALKQRISGRELEFLNTKLNL
ncbi:M1 family metallopeptidase [Gillisia limnaea]|uniref:Aminopeptidase N n=2 Tax=Gillisia TaxID=244698 RepID=H2BTV0_GILLR|nr:Peptidase M1 membrane alanine aminopeptidase [Gillisia limnaea DSM 15749]